MLLGLTCGFGWWSIFVPLVPPPASSLKIKAGSSLQAVADQLADSKIIRSAFSFRLLAHFQGSESAVQAGTYSFTQAASAESVLARLTSGDVDQVRITIPEGFNLQQIAQRLAEAGLADRTKILAAARDSAFLEQLGVKAQSLEGYLFPETYKFVPGISAFELLRMMVRENEHQLQQLNKIIGINSTLNRHQLLTLASIIQKETAQEEEMPLISAVFHNRLKLKIPLQTDPTVIYGIQDFNGNLTRKDLQTPTPYNTYLHPGLPPGPIANPGFSAMLAAVQPAKSDFLYFVARGDGTHQFSASLLEHNRAVRKYQLHR
jgi:UPF0755 protein